MGYAVCWWKLGAQVSACSGTMSIKMDQAPGPGVFSLGRDLTRSQEGHGLGRSFLRRYGAAEAVSASGVVKEWRSITWWMHRLGCHAALRSRNPDPHRTTWTGLRALVLDGKRKKQYEVHSTIALVCT